MTQVDLVRWKSIVDGRPRERDCLAILLTLGAQGEPALELGTVALLHCVDQAAPNGRRLWAALPIGAALREGPKSEPYQAMRPPVGWQDSAIILVSGEPGPPPLVFDVTDAPEGQYEVVVNPMICIPVHITHPPSMSRKLDEAHGWFIDADDRLAGAPAPETGDAVE